MTYTGITTDLVKMRGHNGDDIEAYLARPQGDGPFPGVVVIHHAPGWDEWTLEVTWKLANRGFAVISPHLYARFGPGTPEEASARARAHGGGMPDAQIVGDVSGATSYLRSQSFSNGKVGCIGFCSGGRQSYLVACSTDINAAVDCWGGGVIVDDPSQLNEQRPIAPISLTSNLTCPLLGIFGNDDESPTPSEVDRTEEILKEQHKTYEFYRYEGAGHAFLSTDRYRYRPEQAIDAWNRIYSFFQRSLGSTAGGRGSPPRFIGASPTIHMSGHGPLRPG